MADELLTPEEQRRQVALKSMQAFADKHGFPLEYRVEDKGDRYYFIGKTPDGRKFGVGYLKDAIDA